jgi:hypothetical protein
MKMCGKYFFVFVLLMCGAWPVQGHDSYELKGDILYNDRCNEQVNPVANVFDEDLRTYFQSCPPFGNWVGLDLKEKHVITKIAYCPRMDGDYRDRLRLGVFEGANQADFGDAVPLFIIPGLTERELTGQEIVCTRGFRYVRLVLPYAQTEGKSSYVGELKFYGYQAEGDDSALPQLTNLPVVSIKTFESRDVTSKQDYVKGIFTIIYGNGTKVYTDSVEIRGRGNNSWTHPKKPYRIKLKTSVQLMNLPAKARNWTLINNYGDKTLMRNILAFDFSRRIGMPYTSPAEAVDVVLNGDYKGCYQLCDHIDVRKNRVDIEEMSPGDLTGGYMIEIDAYAHEEPKRFYSYRYNIPVTINYPDDEDVTYAQENFIATHFEKLVSAVYNSNYGSSQTGFGRYVDIESFLRHFLVGEYSGNTDTYWSVRMFKKRSEESFGFSPVWDFDLAFENDWRTYPINERAKQWNEWLCLSNESSAAGGTKDFIRKILSDTQVKKRLAEIYAYYRDNRIISEEILLHVADSCAGLLEYSQDLNFKRWPIMNIKVHENPVVHGSYRAEVANVKKYISERMQWMDNKLNYVPGVNNDYDVYDTFVPEIWANEGSLYVRVPETCDFRLFNLSGGLVESSTLHSGDHRIPAGKGFYVATFVNGQGVRRHLKCFVP